MAVLSAEEKAQRNRDTAALLAKINEVTGTRNTAQTMQTEFFKKAGVNIGINSKTNAVTIDGKSVKDYQYRKEPLGAESSTNLRKTDMQKKKEDRAEEKWKVDSLRTKKAQAEKALAEFDEKAEYDATSAHDSQRWNAEREQLQKAIDQAGAELKSHEETAHRQHDREIIRTMDQEDRKSLEQYAVNQVRDQNLPIELAGMMPTAEQESASFTDKFGKQRAKEMAETFMREENAKLAEQAEGAGRKFAEGLPGWASAATVPINLMSGIVGTVGQLQGAARATGRYKTLDANETGTALDKFSGAVRGQVAQDISGDVYDQNGNQVKDGGILRQLGSYAYQGGMSFIDSTARMLATGGSSGISSAIAGLGAFSQGLQKYSAMGASPQQAALAATASAGLEYITEKLPTEQVLKIFHKGGGISAVKKVLKQAFLVEPLGEEVNLFAGIAAEALILGEKSGKAQRIGDLIAGGMSKAEAEKQFWKETFQEAAETYAVSAVAGGLGAGGAAYAGNLATNNAPEVTAEAPQEVPAEVAPAAPVVDEGQQIVDAVTAEPSTAPLVDGIQDMTPAPEPLTEGQRDVMAAMDGTIGNQPAQENFQEFSNLQSQRKALQQEVAAAEQELTAAQREVAREAAEVAKTETVTEGEPVETPAPTASDFKKRNGKNAAQNVDLYFESVIKANKANAERLKAAQAKGTAKEQTTQPEVDTADVPIQSRPQVKGTGAAEQNFSGKAEYQNMLSDDNAQRDREGDVRPMEVPKTDSFGRRVSELVGNAYGAEITTDKMANTIEELVQEGALGFDVRHNQDSMNNAAEKIAQRGVAATRKQITNAVASGKIRDGDVEQAILLYAMYNSKDTPTAIDNASEILVDLATMANITGRNLQMFRLLRKMTPEGQVTTIRKTVQSNIDSMIKSGAVKKGYTTEIDPELLAEYRKAAGENMRAVSEEQKKASAEKMKTIMDAIYAMEAAKMPATMKAKWDAWRYMAMLGNAKTQVRNIAGNLAFKPYKEVKDKMGALAEKVFVSKDQRTKSLFTDQSLVKWARQDAKTRDIHDALKYSAKLGDDVSTQKIRDNMQVFNNKALDSVRKFVESVPSAGDMLFKNNYYVRSLAGFLKARGYKATDIQSGKVSDTILAEARAYAIQEAMKATFNDSNAFSDFMATGLRYKGDNPFGKALNIAAEGVLPFRRTPANIAVRFSEYSPVGIAKGLWSAATKVRNGEMTAATAIDQLTSGLTGSAVMALGFALAGGMNGIKITGSGADEDEKRQGHQDYALEFSVDGQEYSYKIDWAAPANLPLFVGANIYSVLENAGENTDVSKFTSFIRGMGTAFEPMLALSCMSGLNNLLESARYAEEGEVLYSIVAEAATGYFTQGIPALVRQTYQATQENKQTTFTKSDDPTIRDLQQTAASIPFAGAEYQTDKRNAWGEKETQGDWMTRAFNSFVNPGTLKKIDNSAAELEISRLNKAGYNVTPNTAARTVSYIDKDGTGHDDVRLTEEQFQKLAETQGKTARKLLDDMISSASYAALTDEQKADAIDTAYLYARKTGEIAAIEDHTGYDQSWFYDVEKGGAEEIIRRVLNSGLNTSMSDLDTAWDRGYNEETFNRELQTAYESYSNAPADMRKQVYAEAEGTTKKYIEARDKGVSHEDFVAAAENIAKVKGTGSINKDTGKATVRDIDRRQAIANTTGMTEKEIDIVMKAYMADYDPSDESPETTEMKYDYIRHEMDMSAKEYATTYRAYLDSSKKAQRIAAIRALGYDYGTALKLYKVYSGSMKKKLIDMYG